MLYALPVLFGITIIAFSILSLAPGDPAAARIAPEQRASLTREQLEAVRRELGLDGPVHVRYFRWLKGILHGDFGFSIRSGRPVIEEMYPRIQPTLTLMGTSILLAVIIGIPFGILSAVRQYGHLDYLISTLTILMVSTPTFVLGLLLIYSLGVSLRLLPTGEMASAGQLFSFSDLVLHLIMPATILGFANAAPLMRYTRAGMIEVLNSDYIVTARAKGVRNTAVVVQHGLRNALLPIVTFLGLIVPELVAGAIITEQVFSWPGMGRLAVRAASDRDPSLMMGIVLLVAAAVLAANILTDIVYMYVDPKITLQTNS